MSGGASPRVRGRPPRGRSRRRPRRSIPAGAGPTRKPPPGVPAGAEHPRGCGADCGAYPPESARPGASPRVRGRRGVPQGDDLAEWSIPAGAGPTLVPCASFRARPEHPRGCGADTNSSSRAEKPVGASPRVRGRHLLTWEVTARVPHFHSCASPFVRGSGADGGDRLQRARCTRPPREARLPWGVGGCHKEEAGTPLQGVVRTGLASTFSGVDRAVAAPRQAAGATGRRCRRS
ncbi:hypothetical protein B591_30908 (plasmid) [Streptomyces sp. GBA 94-10 4N24]|nr:hypothetical protein B591_30908 [Streptomyces sp. GBA 94-10 4N24]UZN63161.1 hypothetical protein B591N_30908 [Streptomyces sp. GBA 94-10 4N24]